MWEVKPCVKYLSNTVNGYRVQRVIRTGDSRCSGFDMAFAHESEELCERVAKTINEWEAEDIHISDEEVLNLTMQGLKWWPK